MRRASSAAGPAPSTAGSAKIAKMKALNSCMFSHPMGFDVKPGKFFHVGNRIHELLASRRLQGSF